MKICGISDIHGNLYNEIPKCDVLCICGDIVPLNIQRDIKESDKWFTEDFIKWINNLPCNKVIIVPGNHDFYLERMYIEGTWEVVKALMRAITNDKVEMLIDESYTYKGVSFYGTPWINPISFQQGRWAFELQDNELYNKIPKCDILITHDNPNYNNALGHYTFGKSKVHLFGHWHEGVCNKNHRKYNCSILDNSYNFKKDLNIVTLDFMTQEEITLKTEFIEYLKLVIRDYFKLNGNKPLTLEECNTFLDMQKEFIKALEEDNNEWDTSGNFVTDTNIMKEDFIVDSNTFKETKTAA